MSERRAKIMATLGPASRDEGVLERLLLAGADVVRLNLSHGTHATHRANLATLGKVSSRLGRHVPTLLDLMGPRYRLGDLAEPRELTTGQEVRVGTARGVDVPVGADVMEHIEPGERMLVDNGLVELSIRSKRGEEAVAEVVSGGLIAKRKGINLPDSRLPFVISDKDRADIRFAVEEGADYLGASYVGRAAHIEAIRDEIRAAGGKIPVVAKLERAAALEHLDGIVYAADALMVARGDLGVEVPLNRVPILQKRIVTACREAGRPVIVATQMLESMIEQPRPTRAEATDVANAVFDGADTLMLSGETAAGHYPVEAVETMASIIREAEDYASDTGTHSVARSTPEGTALPDLVAAAAVRAARRGARIVAFSQSGFTAHLLSRHRPEASIIAFTNDVAVARKLQLVWGVQPLLVTQTVRSLAEVVEVVEKTLLEKQLARKGDTVVILMGDPISARPATNLMRVLRLGEPPEPAHDD